MNTQTSEPVIVSVPKDETMAEEPARTIAKTIRAKNAIVMLLGIAGVVITPELSGAMDVLIDSGIVVAVGLWSVVQAFRQGEQTREAVYAPATVAAIAEASQVDVLPGDPKYMPDLRQTARTIGRPRATGRA